MNYYTLFIRPILFRIDPELVHDLAVSTGRTLGKSMLMRRVLKDFFSFQHKSLEQNILGIHFKNPIGLAAGFDKDAQLMNILPSIGLGFEEIGSITALPCKGNPKPRLWRLPKRKSIVVYYGLKNQGAKAIRKKLHKKRFFFPIGISIAKTNCKETVDTKAGVEDYYISLQLLKDYGQYFTINISCPNAFGGQPFTDHNKLDLLLKRLDEIKVNKPIFLKLSPDLSKKELNNIINICDKHSVQGLIISNLTKDRSNLIKKELDSIGQGGISGKLAKEKSKGLISYVYKKTKGRYILIAVGGISSAQEAYQAIKDGASLVQLITGMIYEGPQLIGEMNKGLVKMLKKDGYSNISEAVGTNHAKTFQNSL